MLVGVAGPVAADDGDSEHVSQAKFEGGVDGQIGDVYGTIGEGDERKLDAGLFKLKIDGEPGSGYCIDIRTPIAHGAMLDEIDWDTSGVENLAEVEAILRWYHPNGVGPDDHQITGSDKDKAMATQAAIWHYTDGFALTENPAKNSQTVIDNYKEILAAVDGDGLEGFPGEPSVSLSITPPDSTEGDAGELVGPYVITTTAGSVTVTPSEGVSLHNEDGSPFTDEVVDGTELWLSGAAEGSGKITATAAAEVQAGRVFYGKDSKGKDYQRLILASTVVTDATAEAEVSFVTPTSSTETTETTEGTTTTVPITNQTTVPDQTTAPSTTVTTTPASDSGGLPVTGAQTMVLVAVALVLLATGVGFRVVSRRKQAEG